ncbi:MAG: ABC transporter permease [Solirubrobacteraceae bacterium]
MRATKWLAPALAVILLLAAWQAYVELDSVSRFVLPSPAEVLTSLVTDRHTLWVNFRVTAEELLCGISLASITGLLVAVGLHFSGAAVRRALYPLLVASQAVPIPIVAPLLIVWLGFGLAPKLVVIALVCFFPIVLTTLSGLETVDKELLRLLETFDAGTWQTFCRVELPWALPGLFTGAKLAAVLSVIAAVLAEQSGSNQGLGYLLVVTISNLETAEAFASVLVLAAFAILLFAAITLIERHTLPWIYRPTGTEN